VTSCELPVNDALRPKTSPGTAIRRTSRFPDSEHTDSFARPSHKIKTPRAAWPARNSIVFRGHERVSFIVSRAWSTLLGKSQKSRSGRSVQLRQLCCIALSISG
jgi:hypothetical protein